MDDIVRIDLGVSIVEAELIASMADEAGLKVALLRNEHPETGSLFALGSAALLVRSEDESSLRALLDDWGH